MKYLSLFSGIGGFELGIQQAYEDIVISGSRRMGGRKIFPKQPTCIGYSEIDKYAIQVYNKHFNHKNYGDITTIQPESLPNFDIITGGFPCQSFSIAGKRGGFSDTRGTMFFEIARIVREKQPRLLLLENVKGLLSHDKGNTFYTIISTLDELGYDCQWQVLNSKNFGVPQNRERVFIVGHLRGTSRPEVFPIGEDDKICDERSEKRNKTTNKDLQNIESGRRHSILRGRPRYDEKGKRYLKYSEYQKTVPTLSTMCATGDQKNIVMPQIRRLTPKECERLQGFPDDWTQYGIDKEAPLIMDNHPITPISDTQRYKMCGNAVTVNVIKQIMLKLLK